MSFFEVQNVTHRRTGRCGVFGDRHMGRLVPGRPGPVTHKEERGKEREKREKEEKRNKEKEKKKEKREE